MKRLVLVPLALVLMAAEPAPGPDQALPDPRQEARAQALFHEVRCVVCQHEAIADSPAGVAADMRRLVREQIASGRTDTEVKADLVRRWGDYVLFRPPVRAGTWALWFAPFILGLLGALGLWMLARGRRVEPEPLSPVEEARLDEILADRELSRSPDASPPSDGRSV